jgi:AcrR family transcriptional regulator
VLGNPTRDRRAERREATRQEILEAAWALAREHGLAALSLRDVARVVGLRPPSLYEYFDSKAAIYDAMFAQANRELLEATGGPLEGTQDQRIREGIRRFVVFATEDVTRAQLLFQRTIPGFEPSPASYALAVEALDRVVRALAEVGVDDPTMVDLFTAVSGGLASQQNANEPGGDRWVRLADEAAEMLLGHLRRTKRRSSR